MSKRQRLILILGGSVVILTALLLILFLVILPLSKNNQNDNTFTIDNMKILIDGVDVEGEVNKSFLDDEFILDIEIDNNEELDASAFTIDWSIVSENKLNCELASNGKFTIGDTLGRIIVKVNVSSKNTIEMTIAINIFAPASLFLFELNAVVVDDCSFIEGQVFTPEGFEVNAIFVNGQNDRFNACLTEFVYDSQTKLTPQISDIQVSYTHNNVVRFSLIPIIVYPKKLQNIEVLTPPLTISYIEGQTLDISGLKIIAIYEHVRSEVTEYVINNSSNILVPSDKCIEIFYTEEGITKTTFQNIIVAPRTLLGIIVESLPQKSHYIQGQYFKADGLRVLARYEYFELDVTELVEFDLKDRLYFTDTIVKFSYSERGVKFFSEFNIDVERPYTNVRTIRFENPYDATLSWHYIYMSENGEVSIDNTNLTSSDKLIFDQENGVYTVPVGATITLLKVNPALIGFDLMGKIVNIKYPSNSYEFYVDIGNDDINIDFVKSLGDRLTVRFSSIGVGQNFAFVYSHMYSGNLKENDIAQLAQIYEETENMYYIFSNGINEYTFEELLDFMFNTDTLFIVEAHERISNNAVQINIQYPNAIIKIVLDRSTTISLNAIPKINRVGYSIGFSLTVDGAKFNDSDFNNWILNAENYDTIYAIYTLTANEVLGNIVGTYVYENQLQQTNLTIAFYENGTYSYNLIYNNKLNCSFTGVYKDNLDETYSILSIESEDHSLIATNDFVINLNGNLLSATIFVIDNIELSVSQIPVELEKQIL